MNKLVMLISLGIFTSVLPLISNGQEAKKIVILLDTKVVGSDRTKKFTELKRSIEENIQYILTEASKANGSIDLRRIRGPLQRRTGLKKFVDEIRATHVIHTTFKVLGGPPVILIDVEKTSGEKIAGYPRSVVLFEARQKNPEPISRGIANKIVKTINGNFKGNLFSGCFQLAETIPGIDKTQLKRLPRKLKVKLEKTSLKEKYDFDSFRSTQDAGKNCLNGKLFEAHNLQRPMLIDVDFSGELYLDQFEVVINRNELYHDTIAEPMPEVSEFEKVLFEKIRNQLMKLEQ